MRVSLERAVLQLDGLIDENKTANKAYAELQVLSHQAKAALRDWGAVDSQSRGSGGTLQKYNFVMFHPTLGIMCLTAAVIDGAAAVAAGKVRRGSWMQGGLQEWYMYLGGVYFPRVSLGLALTPLHAGSISRQSPN